MIKVGIISLAHMHGRSYGRILKTLPGVDFVGLYDQDEERATKYAEQFSVRAFSDLDSFLEAVDAVVVCSENSYHAKYTIAAAQGGKHVLCEKPLATSLKDAQKMVEVCAANNVILQTAFPIRFSTPVVEAKAIIESGALGKIVAMNGTNHGKMPPGWFLDPELSGGGAVFDHTVHVTDIMRWYLGCEVKEVYAEVDTALHENIEIDDIGMVTMEFEDGTIATLDPSWSRPKTFPTWGDVTLKVIGTKGTMDIDAFAQAGEVFSDEVGHSKYHYWGDNSNQAMIEDFIASIKEQRQPRVTGFDGLKATEVALAAYQAGREKKPVRLL